jgi:hypothetical protein
MDTREQITQYLEALASKLVELGVTTPFHILVSGGAYMMLQRQRRSTEDIDFALIASPNRPEPNKVFRTTVQRRGEVAGRGSATVFKQAVEAVAEFYGLPLDWMNDESAVYLYDDAPGADVYLWQAFGGALFVYLPTAEYVFALKVAASRRKDQADIKVLLVQLGIASREQAQAIVDKFLLPEAQSFWEVEKKLKRLFR